MIDVVNFLEKNQIFYRTSGPNCAKGHVVINCPFCIASGRGDTGQHLGIELSTGRWGCWRNTAHRGKSLVNLAKTILGVSYAEACRQLGIRSGGLHFTGRDGFDALANSDDLFGDKQEDRVVVEVCELPAEAKPLVKSRRSIQYWNYLASRGFPEEELADIVHEYDLHYADSGAQHGRIIVPVYMYGELVAYTGRHVGSSDLRYRSSTAEESVINIYDSLLNFDSILDTDGGRVLFVTEGPFDAIKVDWYAQPLKCRATCLFTKNISEEQMLYLMELTPFFEKTVLLLDPEEVNDSLTIESQLSHIPNFSAHLLDKNIEDPGAMTSRQISALCRSYL